MMNREHWHRTVAVLVYSFVVLLVVFSVVAAAAVMAPSWADGTGRILRLAAGGLLIGVVSNLVLLVLALAMAGAGRDESE